MNVEEYNTLCTDVEYVCITLREEFPDCKGCPCDSVNDEGYHMCFLTKITSNVKVDEDA